MSRPDRDELRHRLRGEAVAIESTDHIRGRIDRHESALVVALFLAFARAHGLTPAEAGSLLAHPGSAGPRSLELLGFIDRAPAPPGRNAQAGTRGGGRPARTPGR